MFFFPLKISLGLIDRLTIWRLEKDIICHEEIFLFVSQRKKFPVSLVVENCNKYFFYYIVIHKSIFHHNLLSSFFF